MKVTLAKHGGLAAGIRRPPQVVDTDALPAPLAEELARLVAAAVAAGTPPGERPGRARDAMSYTLTVEGDGRTALTQSDTAMTPAFAALLAWLEQH
ncbi:hypothetical protein GobsT_54270 [Gemmata obscuriglobus]|uniref:Uncharacterized protein n=1 Tax=Gemmata obscuriglobus TaxID=114 RepID=A0A2Z3GZ21_9BACT|nr:protealysin inhibitor emfourin [Gemmata obscuriglobus]AWM36727.1 hypothetical protein C1280_06630 [Gemmata obscuriglobus]QEG30622.1 hypothetical protein GobsT_54270 [Gemmata obscuriglobus]VTS09946.1 Uncharacterized protein OS=Streptomyces auratus AGR0001 GN=SU9_32783 PE=4 SV=1 [Gemmata obscuriglobus UQM 2246]